MNHLRHAIAERLAGNGAPPSVLEMAGGLHDFSGILPTQERAQLNSSLRNQYHEYYDDRRDEWQADPTHTPEEANREANAYRRYRLFTFSNFLTTPDTVAKFGTNLEDILADANAGSVLLMMGGRGGVYPTIHIRMDQLADAGGFRRRPARLTSRSPTRSSMARWVRKFGGSTAISSNWRANCPTNRPPVSTCVRSSKATNPSASG